jgi:hypothetical protein
MKKMILFATIIIGLASCGKKDNNATTTTTPVPSTKSYLKMKVDGLAMDFSAFGSASMDTSVEQISFNYINSSGSSVNLVLDDNTMDMNFPRTYVMNNNSVNNMGYFKNNTDPDNNKYYTKVTGGAKGTTTVTVTKVKALSSGLIAINGTFTATLYNTAGAKVEITEGEFFDVRTN